MRNLIFGALGQDGKFLSKQLIAEGNTVFGFVKNDSVIKPPNEIDGVSYIQGNLLDKNTIIQTINSCEPDYIYNFASLSSVKSSMDFPKISSAINFRFVEMILEILRDRKIEGKNVPKLFQASSSEMFGPNNKEPLNEHAKFDPKSPYAIHKLLSHNLCLKFREQYDLPIYTGILFNHESYLRNPNFVSRKITQGAYQIASGAKDFLELGNLDTLRDWGYAGDYVRAMTLITTSDNPADYVIASGQLHSLREICEIAFNEVRLGNYQKYVKFDPKLLRSIDTSGLVGDYSKIKKNLGWEPKKSFKNMIAEMVEFESKSH